MAWRIDGTWTPIHDKLREMAKVKAGKDSQPSASILTANLYRRLSRAVLADTMHT